MTFYRPDMEEMTPERFQEAYGFLPGDIMPLVKQTRKEKCGYDCFKYHRPSEVGTKLIQDVRPEFGKLADLIEAQIPDCRERSLALTALQEAMMYTTAAAVFTDPGAVEVD